MAKIESLNVLADPSGKAMLAEAYGKIIENIQKETISNYIKNKDLSGDPTAGTVEAKRLTNTKSAAYGTARTAGKGAATKIKPVTVSINQDRELIAELEQKDLSLMGLPELLQNRTRNHQLTLQRELDTAFFEEASVEGSAFTTSETEIEEILEAAIQQIETTKNEYIDGVPRELISLTCIPKVYGKIRNYLDKNTNNSNVDTTKNDFKVFHDVRIFSSTRLPANVEFICMVDGAVAQPVMPKEYAAEKIPLSEAWAVELFFYYGTKAVMPDLIIKKTATV